MVDEFISYFYLSIQTIQTIFCIFAFQMNLILLFVENQIECSNSCVTCKLALLDWKSFQSCLTYSLVFGDPPKMYTLEHFPPNLDVAVLFLLQTVPGLAN